MATAVEHGSEPRTPPTPVSLPISGLVGAIYVAGMVAVVLYLIPIMWAQLFHEPVGNALIDWSLRQTLRVVAAAVLLLAGRTALGATPRKGIRGGIFLFLAVATIDFFIWREISLNVNGTTGMALSVAFGALLLFFTFRFLVGRNGEAWMIALEEQGWFHAAAYKRILGQRVRRLTMLGILLLGGTGVYSLYVQGILPEDWKLSMPYDIGSFTLLPDARLMIPFFLMLLTLWVAYRAVNVPSFAEFLIATEAEMNKVSWTPRRRLGQDTIVVLTTTLLMALFLLVVDIFWSWLLSNSLIGVLPAKSTEPSKSGQGQQARW